MAEDLNEPRSIRGTEIFSPQRLIDAGTHRRLTDLFATPTHRDAFVVVPDSTINDPSDASVALHGFPLGAGRASANVVRAVEEHEPYWHHAWTALTIEIGEPQE